MENTSTSLSTRKRSVGVTIAGWILMGFSIWRIAFSVTMLGGAVFYPEIKVSTSSIYTGIIAMAIGTFFIFVGLNLLRLESWARKAILWISWINLITGVLAILTLMPISIIAKLLQIIFGASYLIFFTRPKVKRQFTGAQSSARSVG